MKTLNSICQRFPGANEKGLALIFSLVLLILVTVMGLYGINTSAVAVKRSGNYLDSKQAYYAAKAGIEDGFSRLNSGVVSDQGSEFVISWNNGNTYNSANFSNSFTITHRLAGKDSTMATTLGTPHYLIRSTGTSGMAQKTIEAVYTAKTAPAIFSKAIVGCSKITLFNGVFVDSYDSRLGTYNNQAIHTDPLGKKYANGNGTFATTNDSGTISLDTNSILHGNATATSTSDKGTITTINGATIYGTSTQNAPPSLCDPVTVDALVLSKKPAGSLSDVKLSGTNQTVNAATSPINVKNFELALNSTYTINGTGSAIMYIDGHFQIDSTSKFVVSKGVNLTIYVKGDLDLEGHGINNKNADPKTLIIYAGGGNANFYQNSAFYGFVYAPGANFQTDSTLGSKDFYGAVVGKEVNLKNPQNFHYDEALGALYGIEFSSTYTPGYNQLYVLGK